MNKESLLLKIAEESVEELKQYFCQDERMLKILEKVNDILENYCELSIKIGLTNNTVVRFSKEKKCVEIHYNVGNNWDIILFYSKDRMEFISKSGYEYGGDFDYHIKYERIEKMLEIK